MAVLRQKSRLAKCMHYCRIVTTFLFSHVGLCALVLAYAFGGAFTFHYLEHNNEDLVRNNTKAKRDELVAALWELTENQTVLVYETWTEGARHQLVEFEKLLLHAVQNEGYDGNEYGAEPQWSVTGSMLYSIIVITTIGYGNIAPKTTAGRLVTILYAIAGIPLTLLCLSNIGDVMAHSFKFLYWKVCYTLCIKKKKRKKHKRRHRRHHVVTQQPMSASGIPMQATAASGQFGYPAYLGIGSTHSLPAGNRNFYRQAVRQFSDHHDATRVPIISNTYALQSDITDDPPDPLSTQAGFSAYSGSNTLPTNLTRTQMLRPPPLSRLPYAQNPMNDNESDYTESSDSEDDDEEKGVPIFMIMALVIGYICGGAWLFRRWEDWSYLDAAYFCFVTLTTIGFGDMVPGAAVVSGDGQTTLIICALYLLFGMALLAMSFNLVQEEVAKSVRAIGKKIGIISDNGNKD